MGQWQPDDRRCEVRRVLEHIKHRRSHQVELSQRPHPQNVFDGAVDVFHCVRGMDRLALAGAYGVTV
jgi:hypothetical protein